jgi:hypothetical protein
MSNHLSDHDPWVIPRNDVGQHFEFLMLHPPELRKHVLKLRLLSTIGLLQRCSGHPSPKCRDLLLQYGPSAAEVSEEILRQVLCDDVTLLKLHELIWRGEAGSYWSRKIENALDAEAWLQLDPEVDARIKARVAASVREAFSEDPVAVSHERKEPATAGTSRPRAIARQPLEVRPRTALDGFSSSSDSVTAIKGYDDLMLGESYNAVTLGNGNDVVYVGDGTNTVMFGNGNDYVYAGNGNNTLTLGNGGDDVYAGKCDNLIVAGLGRHAVQVGNGSNILIEGSVQLTQSGDSLRQVFDDWTMHGAQAANVADIRSRLLVTCNIHFANTLHTGSGLDWFWATDTQDNLNAQSIDLRN